jgi:hypothetical protein
MLGDLADSFNFRIAICCRLQKTLKTLIEDQKRFLTIWGRIRTISRYMEQKYESITWLARISNETIKQHKLEKYADQIISRYSDIFEHKQYTDYVHGVSYSRLTISRLVSNMSIRNSYLYDPNDLYDHNDSDNEEGSDDDASRRSDEPYEGYHFLLDPNCPKSRSYHAAIGKKEGGAAMFRRFSWFRDMSWYPAADT